MPGIIEGAKDGKGRGKQVIAVARTCNLIVIVLDAMKPVTHKRIIERELEGFGIRLNKQPPNIGNTMVSNLKLYFSQNLEERKKEDYPSPKWLSVISKMKW